MNSPVPVPAIMLAPALPVVAITVFAEFARAGQPLLALLYGVVVPVGALYEWSQALDQGEVAARVAERSIGFVVLALLGVGAASSL